MSTPGSHIEFDEGAEGAQDRNGVPATDDKNLTPEQKLIRTQQSEIDRLKKAQEALEPLMELVTNTDILERIASGNIPAKVDEPKEDGPKLPVKPAKPQGYNHSEAITDPNSASYKYREAYEAYQEGLADYLSHQEQKKADVERQAVKQQALEEQYRKELRARAKVLKEKFNYTDDEIVDFMKVTSGPSMETLVDFHRFRSGKHKQGQREEQMRRLQVLGESADPDMMTGGGDAEPKSIGAAFSRDLVRMARGIANRPDVG